MAETTIKAIGTSSAIGASVSAPYSRKAFVTV